MILESSSLESGDSLSDHHAVTIMVDVLGHPPEPHISPGRTSSLPAADRQVPVQPVLQPARQTSGPQRGAAHRGAVLAQPGGGILCLPAQ